MVAVEAAAHGVPTIAFATGGIVDAVAEGESGRLIRPGDYGAFAGVVIESLANHLQLTESCRNFSERFAWPRFGRSEEHTSELQSLMRISYAVFCLKKKKTRHTTDHESKQYLYSRHNTQLTSLN